jgi:MazG family protein
MAKTGELFEKLVEIVAKLRDPISGCPWDKEQTHASLKPYLIEESYEVNQAIDNNSSCLADELGDVLLQIILHSQIGSDSNKFTIQDVVSAISKKMIRRHPHVFGDKKLKTSQEVLQNWEKIKQEQKKPEELTSVLDGVPPRMPALLRAQRTSEKAARVGFDWPTFEKVCDKVEEEFSEFKEVAIIKKESKEKIADELGDIFYALTQVARKLDLNAEELLHQATDKFTRRFKEMEKRLSKAIHQATLNELDQIWEEVKKDEVSTFSR